jgi:hypothetical protein
VLGSRGIAWAFASIATILTAVAWADTPTYLCTPAKVQRDGSEPRALALADRVSSRTVQPARTTTACWDTAPSTALLEGFAAPMRLKKERRTGEAVTLVTRFGRETLALKALDEIRVPSPDGGTPSGYVCYSVRRGRARAAETRVVVTDAANGEQTFDVGRAVRVCAPPSGEIAPELVCHAIKLAKTKPLGQ